MSKRDRTLIIIGGHEDRTDGKEILREVARRTGGGKLVVCTVATEEPDELFDTYDRAFRALGVRHVHRLMVDTREEAKEEGKVKILDDAATVFFTGGDQLRITSQLGDSPTYQRIQQIYHEGGTVAGTSAGASVVCETMIVSGNDDESFRVGASLRLAPGLGLIDGVIVDQHFSERGRIGRLLGAVSLNPAVLGLGIDENTAIVVESGRQFRVIGEGAVYAVDGSPVTFSNVAEAEQDQVLSAYDVKMHVLSRGDAFDLDERRPRRLRAEAAV
jgi:cyanophycinase